MTCALHLKSFETILICEENRYNLKHHSKFDITDCQMKAHKFKRLFLAHISSNSKAWREWRQGSGQGMQKNPWMLCQLLSIKVSTKCINVNVCKAPKIMYIYRFILNLTEKLTEYRFATAWGSISNNRILTGTWTILKRKFKCKVFRQQPLCSLFALWVEEMAIFTCAISFLSYILYSFL